MKSWYESLQVYSLNIKSGIRTFCINLLPRCKPKVHISFQKRKDSNIISVPIAFYRYCKATRFRACMMNVSYGVRTYLKLCLTRKVPHIHVKRARPDSNRRPIAPQAIALSMLCNEPKNIQDYTLIWIPII